VEAAEDDGEEDVSDEGGMRNGTAAGAGGRQEGGTRRGLVVLLPQLLLHAHTCVYTPSPRTYVCVCMCIPVCVSVCIVMPIYDCQTEVAEAASQYMDVVTVTNNFLCKY